MARIRVSMLIDDSALARMLAAIGPADAVVVEINRVPTVAPTPEIYRRPPRRPYNPRPKRSARAFILQYAEENGTFNLAKELVPAGVSIGYQKNTLYSTCTRLAKTGALVRTDAGQYQIVKPTVVQEVA